MNFLSVDLVSTRAAFPAASLANVLDRLRHALGNVPDGGLTDRSRSHEACLYQIDSGGSHVRANLALQAGAALGLGAADTITIATVVELLHNASLIHDDLQDGSPCRRGLASVWKMFGANIAICAGDLMLSAAYGALSEWRDTSSLRPVLFKSHEAIARSVAGQSADLDWQDTSSLDVEAYRLIAASKSGALFGLPLELTLIASGHAYAGTVARDAADHFAIGYQIADDIADAVSDADTSCRQASMNIMSILSKDGVGGTPLSRASTLARQHLRHAAALSLDLPEGSGAYLHDLTLSLLAKV